SAGRIADWVLALPALLAIVVSCLRPCDGAVRPLYSNGSEAGSNKIVVNPANGGDSQRRARARPIERTRPAASSSTSARCTVRWLAPRARPKAEVDQAAPSESSATSDA